MYGVWIAPLFIMGTLWAGHRQNPRKGWKEGKGEKIEDQDLQRTSSISSKSSSSMFMIVIWSFLASSMSLMKGSLHFSSGCIGQYSTWKASVGRRSLMFALSVFNRMFLRFDPVVDLASCRIEFKRCFDECLLDFWICSRNLRNLLMKTVLICVVPLSGWIRYRCVSLGMSIISLMDTFHEFSTIIASLLNKSHKQHPVKCEL